ncbi:transporter substrate-binding domain-containing protein [Calothrix sp. 336/3]|uniref:transporter substrate-binding domain-containing protein n=1 Tax=Calothrix sp. 336/3 TaxID=1337936 RepID=UPI0009E56397|nr:transporter substrate-binding domain-containing protein [Calothrix sp. 336/3]
MAKFAQNSSFIALNLKFRTIIRNAYFWWGNLRSSLIIFALSCFLLFPLPCRASEFTDIQQRGYLKVAVKDNLPPLGFKDSQGNLQGLEIDLAQQIGQDLLGKTASVKFIPVNNRDRLTVILKHQADITIARVTATASRNRVINFSVPYYFDGTRLLTKGTEITSLSELNKRKIAVLSGSSTIATIKYYLPQAELVGVKSYLEGRSLLDNGSVTAFAADGSILSGWVQESPQYRLIPTKLSTEPLAVVMPKGLQYDELRRKINGAIARYLETGWLKQRAVQWGLPFEEIVDKAETPNHFPDNKKRKDI